jgi:hypothetical protein
MGAACGNRPFSRRRQFKLDHIPWQEYTLAMWEVEFTDEFGAWWNTLDEAEREAVSFSVNLLRQAGPSLEFPHTSGIYGSKHRAMRELRSQCAGRPLRTFFAFDRRRVAILLLGGDKTGNDRFYDEFVPLADKIYDEYLREMGVKK